MSLRGRRVFKVLSVGVLLLLLMVPAAAEHRSPGPSPGGCGALNFQLNIPGNGVYLQQAIAGCNVVINQPGVHWTCINGGALVGAPGPIAVTVNAPNVTIRGCALVGPTTWGIQALPAATGLRVEDCDISGMGVAIQSQASQTTLVGNDLHENTTVISLLGGPPGTSKHLILKNRIDHNAGIGLFAQNIQDSTIKQNLIMNGGDGMHLTQTSNLNTLVENEVYHVGLKPIALTNSHKNVILRNDLEYMPGPSSAGICLDSSTINLIKENTVLYMTASPGILLMNGSVGNVVKLNNVDRNDIGIVDSSGGNTYPTDPHTGNGENQCVSSFSGTPSVPPGLCNP